MKKALFIFMAFALITPMIFAEVVVEGDATLTWGYNAETEAHGFYNKASAKVIIPLLADQTFTGKSDGDNFAEINIVTPGFNAVQELGERDASFAEVDEDADEDLDVNAKLVFGDVYATVYNKPSFKAGYASIFDPLVDDTLKGFISGVAGDHKFEGWGTKIGFANDDLDFGIKVASQLVGTKGTYNAEKDDSKYAFGADAKVTAIDGVEIEGSFNYATWEAADGNEGIITLGAKVALTPIEDLEVIVGFDAGKAGKDDLLWDASLSAEYQFVSAGLYVEDKWGADKDGKEILDMAAWVQVADEGDLVENLDASLAFAAYHFLSSTKDFEGKAKPLPMGLAAELAYKVEMNDVNYLKPFFNFWMGNYYNPISAKEAAKFANAFEIGAEYGLFTNTTVTAKFVKGSTLEDDTSGLGIIETDSADDKGLFTVAVKIKY